MARYDGRGFPPLQRRSLDGLRLRTLDALRRDLVVRNGSETLRFRCETTHEYNRATHALVQEPGTVDWIEATVRPGDVFFDVGANIGIFTLMVASRVGSAGRVCAFEPHAGTLVALMHNVVANGFTGRVDVLACALHDSAAWLPFHYRSLLGASGLSQLDATRDPFGHEQDPVVSELKPAISVDRLVADDVVPTPTVVKIDVDGNEPAILRGMAQVFSRSPPRSVQVEVNPSSRDEVLRLLHDAGYQMTRQHRTRGGERLISEGHDPASIGFNGIFERAECP